LPLSKDSDIVNWEFIRQRLDVDERIFASSKAPVPKTKSDLKPLLDIESLDVVHMNLLEILASDKYPAREKLSEYWEDSRYRIQWLSRLVEEEKKRYYPKLAESNLSKVHHNEKKGGSSGEILDEILDYIYSQEPSEDLLELVKHRLNELLKKRDEMSIEEMAIFRRLENFISMLNEKIIFNRQVAKELVRKYEEEHLDYQYLVQNPDVYIQRLKEETGITDIARKSSGNYHNYDDCPDWRSLFLEYVQTQGQGLKNRGEIETSNFSGKKLCSFCADNPD